MLKVKNWETFQSYKDRSPPWIRLHKRLLDDYNFQRMSSDARAILPMIWLLISEDENPVSGLLRIGYEEVSFRLRQPEKVVKSAIDEIISFGFLEQINDDKSTCYETVTKPLRNCHSETETETETETDKGVFPDCIPKEEWGMYKKHRGKKFTDNAQDLAIKKLEKWHSEGYDIKTILENSVMNGWSGLFLPKDAPKVAKKWKPF